MKKLKLQKTEFNAEDEELACLYGALAHPARLLILKTLAERGECICGEIVNVVPLAQSTVSQHLKHLRRDGLIQGEVDGPRSCYCINSETLARLQQLSKAFTKTLATRKKGKCHETD